MLNLDLEKYTYMQKMLLCISLLKKYNHPYTYVFVIGQYQAGQKNPTTEGT